jgi:hypothetical protein
VAACQHDAGPLLTQQASGLDCPTKQALVEATRANVENGMVSLLVAGFIGIAVTLVFALADRRSPGGGPGAKFFWGFVLTVVVWAAGWVGLLLYRDWFIRWAHYVAGIGVLLCILAVTLANALRRQARPTGGRMATAGAAVGTLFRWPLDPYAWVAWAMLVGIAVTGPLFLLNVITLFWLEIVVAVVFVAFWVVQTVELLNPPVVPDPTAATPQAART